MMKLAPRGSLACSLYSRHFNRLCKNPRLARRRAVVFGTSPHSVTMGLEAIMSIPHEPILLDHAEAAAALKVTPEDLTWLVQTHQLLPVTICGQRRFLQQDLSNLAKVYQLVQNRKQQA